ncbi:hypothetical protein Plec18167_001279 [Paecilomyces lecythidis]|uniref:Uncharacterized protein n=1 Tax=Paecilomyces lecythidis TaxID=3004212 RepID=A0ABR3YE90_9EURO
MDGQKQPRKRKSLPWSLFSRARDRNTRGENQDEMSSSIETTVQEQSPPSQTLARAPEILPSPPPTPSPPRRVGPRDRRRVRFQLPTIPEDSAVIYDREPSKSGNTRKRKHQQASTGRVPVPVYAVPDPSRVGERVRIRRSDPQMHHSRPPVPLRERQQPPPLLGLADPGLTVRTFITERPDPFASNPLRRRGPPRNHNGSYFSEMLDFPPAIPELPFRPSGVPIPGRNRELRPPVMTPAGPRTSSGARRGDAGRAPPPPPPPPFPLRHAGPSIGSRPPPPAQNEPRPATQDPFAGFQDSSGLVARRSGKEMPSRYRGGQPKGGQ